MKFYNRRVGGRKHQGGEKAGTGLNIAIWATYHRSLVSPVFHFGLQ